MTDEHPTHQESSDETGREAPGARWDPADLAVDHTLAMLSESLRFLLDVTPEDAEEQKDAFLAGSADHPEFTYRELEADPDVTAAQLRQLPVDAVSDATLRELLAHKRREMELQVEMLRARGSDAFRELSVELYGGVSEELVRTAQQLVDRIEVAGAPAGMVDAEDFLEAAQDEIERYRRVHPDVSIHAEVRTDTAGVLVEGDTLLISERASVPLNRVDALIHHEVGTHLVTQVNGSGQPLKTLGSGLAGYDETQEGLAVLGEIAVGGLTPFRLRQLAVRVLTVHRMLSGASFREALAAMVAEGVPERSAYTTTMRVYRSGGLTKDAVYLRGLLDLLAHLRDGGRLDLLFLGKFALADLPLVQDLDSRGLLRPARVTSHWLLDPGAAERLKTATQTTDLSTLTLTQEKSL